MIPVLSRDEVRAFDKHAVIACKVPSVVLMENAGRGATDVLVRELFGGDPARRRVVIVAGTGNNGGDGFVVARHLLLRGARPEVWLVGDPSKMTKDCQVMHDAFAGVGGTIELVVTHDLAPLRAALAEADVAIDALFGTGLDRPVMDPLDHVVGAFNEALAPKVALDVPSGMNADTGGTMGAAIRADLTVTFAHPKLGLLTGRGAALAGKLHVVDIGVPRDIGSDPDAPHRAHAGLLEASDVIAAIAPRTIDAHKYTAGHVAVLGGSPGKVGAALLAAQGALRGGAGAATIVTWADAASAIEARVVEVMTQRIDEADVATSLDALLGKKASIVVGPGFGTDDRARDAVRHVLATCTQTVVLDADALTLHAGAIDSLAGAAGRLILTPHAGELGRLLGKGSEEIEADRYAAAREASKRANAIVLLKGPSTIIAAPDGQVAINSTGNPALATAGSGDVLAGLAGALAAGDLSPFRAAACAAYIHGAAGDAWAESHGDRGLFASDLAAAVPDVLRRLIEP